MADPQQVLAQRVRAAIVASFGPEYGGADPVIRPSSFADFRRTWRWRWPSGSAGPAEVAGELAARLDVTNMCAGPRSAGPASSTSPCATTGSPTRPRSCSATPGSGSRGAGPQRVVVEYSSPNIAKEMHVGHLRTTIVGDAIARVLEFPGHRVIRDNHVGDWGTPFGMLIEHLLDVGEDSAEAALLVTDPNAFYQAARRSSTPTRRSPSAPAAGRALQAGDPDTLAIWQLLVDISKEYLHRIYARLGVTLTDADIRGESFYNHMLADTASVLEEKGIATDSDGALCAFPPGSPAARASRCR